MINRAIRLDHPLVVAPRALLLGTALKRLPHALRLFKSENAAGCAMLQSSR